MRQLNIIVCVDSVGGFALKRKIPWHYPLDLQRFVSLTKGNICIMGRHTYLEIAEKKSTTIEPIHSESKLIIPTPDLLPDRMSIVLTSNPTQISHNCQTYPRLRQAVQSKEVLYDPRKIFILGGERLFIEALTWTTHIYMTIIKNKYYGCDKFFYLDALKKFRITEGSQSDDLYFVTYQRIAK